MFMGRVSDGSVPEGRADFKADPCDSILDADEEEDDEFDLIERAEAALKDDEEFEPVVKA